MKDKIEKGFNLSTKETFDKLVNIINDSGLPIVVSKYIVRDILSQIEQVEKEQIAKEEQEYQLSLKKEKEDKEDKK